MNTNFETKFGGGKVATVEWYTPPYIIEALGNDFDLDPAAPKREWYTARKCFTKRRRWISPRLERFCIFKSALFQSYD